MFSSFIIPIPFLNYWLICIFLARDFTRCTLYDRLSYDKRQILLDSDCDISYRNFGYIELQRRQCKNTPLISNLHNATITSHS